MAKWFLALVAYWSPTSPYSTPSRALTPLWSSAHKLGEVEIAPIGPHGSNLPWQLHYRPVLAAAVPPLHLGVAEAAVGEVPAADVGARREQRARRLRVLVAHPGEGRKSHQRCFRGQSVLSNQTNSSAAFRVAVLLVAVVAAVVLVAADLVPLDAEVVCALEVGEDVGADLGPVGAQRVVVLITAVAAVVHQEVQDALQVEDERSSNVALS